MSVLNVYSKYSFDTYAPVVLGHSYANMTLHGILSYEEALKKDVNIPDIHSSVVAYSDEVVQHNEVASSVYYYFRKSDGSEIVLNSKWIIASTVVGSASNAAAAMITIVEENVNSVLSLLDDAEIDYDITQ